MVTRANGATVTRTFTIVGRSAEVKTVVEAEPGRLVQVDSTLLLKGLEDAYTGTYNADTNGFHLVPVKPGYEVEVSFGQGTYATAADKDFGSFRQPRGEPGNGKIGDAAGALRGRWLDEVNASGRLETSVRINVTTQQDAADSDGDGLPDKWEEEGRNPLGRHCARPSAVGSGPESSRCCPPTELDAVGMGVEGLREPWPVQPHDG